MPEFITEQSYFLIEFEVDRQYGALICKEYRLTEQMVEINEKETNLIPIYICQHVEHLSAGPIIVASGSPCITLDGIQVRKVSKVTDLRGTIKRVLTFRGQHLPG